MDDVKYASLDAVTRILVSAAFIPNGVELTDLLESVENFLRNIPPAPAPDIPAYYESGEIEINALTMGLVDPIGG